MNETDLWLLTLSIIFTYFVGFISGFATRASFSQYRRYSARKAREARHARLVAAEGEPRPNGKAKSSNVVAVVTSLVVVSVAIVVDYFRGPLFPDAFYCLNDGGTQVNRMCTGRLPNGRDGTAHRNLVAETPLTVPVPLAESKKLNFQLGQA